MAHLSLGLKTLLRAHAGLTALVAQRIYRGEQPQKSSAPYVVFRQIDDDPVATMAGNRALTRTPVAVESVAATDAQALLVAAQVKAAMSSYMGSPGGVEIQSILRSGQTDEGLDEDTRLYTIEQTYTVWYLDA